MGQTRLLDLFWYGEERLALGVRLSKARQVCDTPNVVRYARAVIATCDLERRAGLDTYWTDDDMRHFLAAMAEHAGLDLETEVLIGALAPGWRITKEGEAERCG